MLKKVCCCKYHVYYGNIMVAEIKLNLKHVNQNAFIDIFDEYGNLMYNNIELHRRSGESKNKFVNRCSVIAENKYLRG